MTMATGVPGSPTRVTPSSASKAVRSIAGRVVTIVWAAAVLLTSTVAVISRSDESARVGCNEPSAWPMLCKLVTVREMPTAFTARSARRLERRRTKAARSIVSTVEPDTRKRITAAGLANAPGATDGTASGGGDAVRRHAPYRFPLRPSLRA